ncbi:MAG: helix-turn-helix domain-containing protein [Verrucomicrobiae bacterium]|nr:helix-turn-helix domain-containing protein [Verrucomicrobiae bacterium]
MNKHHASLSASGCADPRPATQAFWAAILGFVERWIGGMVCRLRRILTIPTHIECQTRSVREAAAELGLSEITVRRLVARGRLRRLADIGCVRITRRSIRDYLDDDSA